MARIVKAKITLQLEAGRATPAPPVGPALGSHGVNIVEFTKIYNERTSDQVGSIIPAEITIYEDRSFTFVTKTPPVADLLRKAVGVEKGSGEPNLEKVGSVTKEQVLEIAAIKMPDLNTYDMDAAVKTVAGTARSMGIDVEG